MSDASFKLSVRYAAGHTHEFAPSGEALTGDQLHQASGAFLNDLTYLKGEGITRLVAEILPVRPPAGWRIEKQVDDGQDTEARLLLVHSEGEQALLIIWPADDDPDIHMVHPCGTCPWEGPCSHG